MTWGLQPAWAVRKGSGFTRINARVETVREAAFRGRTPYRRCLVPATGYYEWRTEADGKVPYLFRLESGATFAFAGLYDPGEDTSDAGEGHGPTVAIITTEPNALAAAVHDRMPAILPPQDEAAWANPAVPWAKALRLVRPYPADQMVCYPVERAVNNARHDDPRLIEPGGGPNSA